MSSIDQIFQHICQVVVNGKTLQNNSANRGIVTNWVHEDQGETLSASWFKKVLSEQPELADQLSWEVVQTPESRNTQLEQDKKVFVEVCKQHSLSACEANFGVWRSTGSIAGLAPATREEAAKYLGERIEQYNESLLQASPSELRAQVRYEADQKRVQDQKSEADEQLKAAQERDSHRGYPVLPSEWSGQKLDAAFIKNCSAEVQKLLTKRFGSSQLTARLRGLG
jgi:hypothetical protein